MKKVAFVLMAIIAGVQIVSAAVGGKAATEKVAALTLDRNAQIEQILSNN